MYPFFLFLYDVKKIAGIVNKEIQNKLNAYVPSIEVILISSKKFEKLYAIKFHGKPVNIEPLTNSITPKINEKIKKETVLELDLNILNRNEVNP